MRMPNEIDIARRNDSSFLRICSQLQENEVLFIRKLYFFTWPFEIFALGPPVNLQVNGELTMQKDL